MSKKPDDCVDATEPLMIYVKEKHILNGERYHKSACMYGLSICEMFPGAQVVICENFIKIKFKGEKQFTRYQSTPSAKMLFATFERGACKALKKMNALHVPKGGIRIIFAAPRPSKTLKFLRSQTHKARQKKNRDKTIILRKEGVLPRKYTRSKVLTINTSNPNSISLESMRSGQGYSVKAA